MMCVVVACIILKTKNTI